MKSASMRTCKIPRTDLEVSRIAYGCGALASIGRPKPPTAEDGAEAIAKFKAAHSTETIEKWKREPLSADVIDKAARMVHAAHDHGITLFDHADIYGFGKAEEAFGEVLRRSPGLRDRIVIQTKCGICFARERYKPLPGDPHRLDLSREHIVRSAEGSLKRLGTDHIDILLLHRPDALVEPAEVAQAFDELHASGKVRYFGVSNHTPMQIELLQKYLDQPLVVNQVQVSLAFPHLIAEGLDANRDDSVRLTRGYSGADGTLDYCRVHDIQIQAYAPLRGGNRVLPPHLLNPPVEAPPSVKRAAKVLADMAEKKATTRAALALAWLLRHPARIVPIIGASHPEHVIEDCAADRVTLSPEEWYELFVAVLGVPGLFLFGVVLPKTYTATGDEAKEA